MTTPPPAPSTESTSHATGHPPAWFYAGSFLALVLLGLALDRIGDAVRIGRPNDFDHHVHAWVVSQRPNHPEVTRAFLLVTRFGNPGFAISITIAATILLFTLSKRKFPSIHRTESVAWLFAIIGGRYVNIALKAFFRRDRPPLADRLVVETAYSYPSGHSVFAAVFFTMLAMTLHRLIPPDRRWLRRGAVAACLLSAVVVAASRVWLGVHYPTDVMAGLALGVGWAYSIVLVRRAWTHWRAWAYPKA